MPRPEATSLSSKAWSYAPPRRHRRTTRPIDLAHKPRHLPTELLPHIDVEPVVNAGVNPRQPGFLHHRIQAIGLRWEELAQHLGGGPGEAAVRRGVRRVIGQTDRRDEPDCRIGLWRTNEPVRDFRVRAADRRIHHGRVEQREYMRRLALAQPTLLDPPGGDHVPEARDAAGARALRPE